MKGMGNKSLKELAERFGVQKEYQALKAQAELGKQYQRQLQDSVVRLGLDPGSGGAGAGAPGELPPPPGRRICWP